MRTPALSTSLLLLCFFSVGFSSPTPAQPVGDGAPALMERAPSSNSADPIAAPGNGGNPPGLIVAEILSMDRGLAALTIIRTSLACTVGQVIHVYVL
ncbi:hypothetical protein FS749_011793 [Ceratobasidium sp. UAMH 11750]|nr:hypothetical protein FS749_011793 [Ceratobasidium sp. UAMH 11750]